jgi:succinate-acetate transporter protein
MLYISYGSIIAAMAFYINLVSTLKHINKEQDTSINTIIGSLLLGFILFSIFMMCGSPK